MPVFFDRYIHLVEQEDLFESFKVSMDALNSLDMVALNKIGDKRYQADKWTTKDVIQHIIDNERIQSYRALRFARHDNTELPGYDENLLGRNSKAINRTIDELIEELKTLRTSTIQLFNSFDKSDLTNIGIASNQTISVLALGFVIVGHQIHHFNVIKERYLPLIH